MNGRYRSPLCERAQQIKQAREALAVMFTDGRIITGSTLIDQPTEIVGMTSIEKPGGLKHGEPKAGNRLARQIRVSAATVDRNTGR